MSDLETEKTLNGDEKIIAEAKRRFHQCESWEANARKLFLDDLKFSNADTDNGYQWPNAIRRNRDIDERPCLTINKTRQHNLQIINDAKKNTPSIKIHPTGDGATYQSAQVFEGVVRRIEYISNAAIAYDCASTFQVQGGIGYWRVVTDYTGEDSFDQDIFIRRIRDPLNVFLDPDIAEVDGSDARYGFVFDDMSLEDFEKAYPKYKDKASQAALGNGDGWIDTDHVRVCEYFRKEEKEDRLLAFTNPSTGRQEIIPSRKVPKDLLDQVVDAPDTEFRTTMYDVVMWYLIVGDEVIERREWPGKYIPIVRVVGEETIIDGKLDRKGHTRALKDPQRMYNYFASSSVEHLALQTKIPFIAPAKAIEGVETYWETSNTVNHAVLPYNHVDDDGNEMPAPTRAQSPTPSSGYLEAMKVALNEMMMVSGQYEANFGQKSNEKSGIAIQERQRQGDTATYHFIDNLAIGIRFTGKIIMDLIPKVYDTARVMRIMAQDGQSAEILIDPQARVAWEQKKQKLAVAVAGIFNPNVGKYDVQVDVGPGYATKREEAFNAFSQIATQNPELMNVIGDLLFKNADFPGADEIAERLQRLVPPQAKGEGPTPEMQMLQSQLDQLMSMNSQLLNDLEKSKMELKDKEQKNVIDTFKAVTDRLNVLEKHFITPKDESRFLHDLVVQDQVTNMNMLRTQEEMMQPSDVDTGDMNDQVSSPIS